MNRCGRQDQSHSPVEPSRLLEGGVVEVELLPGHVVENHEDDQAGAVQHQPDDCRGPDEMVGSISWKKRYFSKGADICHPMKPGGEQTAARVTSATVFEPTPM